MTAEYILSQALKRLGEGAKEYDQPKGERSAQVAGEILRSEGVSITTDDVWSVLIAIKKARLKATPGHVDSHIDLVAYEALRAEHRLSLQTVQKSPGQT